MDILHTGRQYAVMLPQLGGLEQQPRDELARLVEALERGGAKIGYVAFVPGINRVQFVDITKEEGPIGLGILGEAAGAAREEVVDRATATKSFGA